MGESDLVDEMYRVALPRLCRYGFLLTGSEAEGEELVQAAIVKTFSRWRRFPEVGAAEGYVRAAMRTMTIDAGRRATRWRRAAPRLAGRDERLVDDEVVAAHGVGEAIRALPPRVRVAVALRYLDDLTLVEVAARMGVTDGAVKKYLHTARERLEPWRLAAGDVADAPGGDHEPLRVRVVRKDEGRRARWPKTS